MSTWHAHVPRLFHAHVPRLFQVTIAHSVYTYHVARRSTTCGQTCPICYALHVLYTIYSQNTSEALEAKGVTTNATKKAGMCEALEKPLTASTIGSAKSPTTTPPVCVCVCVCVCTHTHTHTHKHGRAWGNAGLGQRQASLSQAVFKYPVPNSLLRSRLLPRQRHRVSTRALSSAYSMALATRALPLERCRPSGGIGVCNPSGGLIPSVASHHGAS
jgi:hypothetical protein